MSWIDQRKAGVTLSYINVGITIVLSLLYTPILLRMLGQSEFGLYSIAYSAFGLLSILHFGFGNANIRYTAKYLNQNKDQQFSLYGLFLIIYAVIGFISLTLGIIISYYAESFFGKNMTVSEVERLKFMLYFVTISISISFPLSTFGFIIRGYERFTFSKSIELLRIIFIPVISVILLYSGYKSVGLIVSITILNILLLMAEMIYSFKVLKIKIKINFLNYSLIKEIIFYSFFVILGMISFQLNNNANQFILGSVSGTVQVAVYALGFNLLINFQNLAFAIISVFLPTITRISEDENKVEQYNHYFIAVGRIQFYVLALFYFGFIVFGKQFITLWAGSEYENSYYICIIPLTSLSIYLLQSLGITIMQAQNKHKFSSVLFTVMSVFNIATSIFLSKYYGAIGGAISIALTWLIGHGIILNFYYSSTIKLDIILFWKQIIKLFPILIIPIIFGILYIQLFEKYSWLTFSIGIILFTLFYVISAFFIGFNQFEKNLLIKPIINLAKSRFSKVIK